MDTHTTHEDLLSQLSKSNTRWRLLAVSSITLMVGIGIGGMGTSVSQDGNSDPKAVIDRVGLADRIVRFHADGTMSYLRFPQGDRTVDGYYDWGAIKIDPRYTSRTLPQP
jgi:hypothetical protein